MLATDDKGSVLSRVSQQGARSIAYSVYGYSTNEVLVNGHLGYNGELRNNPTGNYFLGKGYRMFDTWLMRFQQPDGVEWSPFGRGGINTYGFADGAPTTNVDPSGHFTLKFWKWFRPKVSATSGSKAAGKTTKVKPEPLVKVQKDHIDALKSVREFAHQQRISSEVAAFDEASRVGVSGVYRTELFLQNDVSLVAVAYRESIRQVQGLDQEISSLSSNVGRKAITKSRAQELRGIADKNHSQNKGAFEEWKRLNSGNNRPTPWMLRNNPARDKFTYGQ